MSTDLGAPSRYWSAVTPSDVTNLPQESSYLYVGVSGDVTAVCAGTAILFKSLAVGYHPIRCSRVNSTGTTATNILAAN